MTQDMVDGAYSTVFWYAIGRDSGRWRMSRHWTGVSRKAPRAIV
ncbi:hypothetical protein [Telmatospirillum sp.]|nr:hypothetical protein [Telmatospirillum sp.]MDR3438299.1 hypothetical protein [Telmatospirillum sp.]